MDWFLHDRNLHHERVKKCVQAMFYFLTAAEKYILSQLKFTCSNSIIDRKKV